MATRPDQCRTLSSVVWQGVFSREVQGPSEVGPHQVLITPAVAHQAGQKQDLCHIVVADVGQGRCNHHRTLGDCVRVGA